MHGGAAGQVQRSAAERVAALVDPAFRAMARSLKSRDMGAVVRAARDILDRAGVRPDTHTTADVTRMLRSVVEIVMRNVADPGERAAISSELSLLSRREREPGLAARVTAAPRLVPAPKPQPLAEIEIL